jgi:hypothetical protein
MKRDRRKRFMNAMPGVKNYRDCPRLVQGTMTIEKKTIANAEGRKPPVTPMSFAMTQKWESRLLRPRLVREDIFIQGLEPDEVEMIREASERGLKPGGFSVEGTTLILRFDQAECVCTPETR